MPLLFGFYFLLLQVEIQQFVVRVVAKDFRNSSAESAKTLTGLVAVNKANKIATRLVYDTHACRT